MNSSFSRRLKMLGMFLFLLGLITGFATANMKNPRMGLAAHLEGIMNGIFLIAAGLIWNDLKLLDGMKTAAYRTLIYGTFVNWFITLIAACSGAYAMSPVTGHGFGNAPDGKYGQCRIHFRGPDHGFLRRCHGLWAERSCPGNGQSGLKTLPLRKAVKRFLATIFAFIYLSTSTGATLHLHYCMGRLASWGLINHERNTCAQCGMPVNKTNSQNLSSKKNCCRDEHKQIKTGSDQKLSPSAITDFSRLSSDIALHRPISPVFRKILFSIAFPATNSPPYSDTFSRNILYCNFRL